MQFDLFRGTVILVLLFVGGECLFVHPEEDRRSFLIHAEGPQKEQYRRPLRPLPYSTDTRRTAVGKRHHDSGWQSGPKVLKGVLRQSLFQTDP